MKKENQVLFRIMAELVLLLALMTDVLVTVLFSLFKINVEAMTSLDFNQLFQLYMHMSVIKQSITLWPM